MKTGPGQTILLFTTLEAGKKLGTLGWVAGTTKTQTKKTKKIGKTPREVEGKKKEHKREP